MEGENEGIHCFMVGERYPPWYGPTGWTALPSLDCSPSFWRDRFPLKQ